MSKNKRFFIQNGWPVSIGDSFKPPSSLIQISRQAPKQPLNDDAATLFVIHFSKCGLLWYKYPLLISFLYLQRPDFVRLE